MHLKFQFQAVLPEDEAKPPFTQWYFPHSQTFPSLPGVWSKLSVVRAGDCSVAKDQCLVQFLEGSFCRCLTCVINKCACSVLSRGTKKQDALMIMCYQFVVSLPMLYFSFNLVPVCWIFPGSKSALDNVSKVLVSTCAEAKSNIHGAGEPK